MSKVTFACPSPRANAHVRLGRMGLFLGLLMLFTACRDVYKAQEHERELERLRSAISARGGKPVWDVDGLLYGPAVLGDSLALADGDSLLVAYSLWGLSARGETLLASNIAADMQKAGLPIPWTLNREKYNAYVAAGGKTEGTALPDSLYTYTDTALLLRVGHMNGLLPSLAKGIRLFAHGEGSGWIGIPSGQGYGGYSYGGLPPNTPLCCYVRVQRHTAKKANGGL